MMQDRREVSMRFWFLAGLLISTAAGAASLEAVRSGSDAGLAGAETAGQALAAEAPRTVASVEILCRVMVNTETVARDRVLVPEGSRAVFAETNGYSFRVGRKASRIFEIEFYDPSAPMRGYASGTLKTADDEVQWALWTRDILLEASCRL